jgi:thiol-disulfide isomerase/thioredoxin
MRLLRLSLLFLLLPAIAFGQSQTFEVFGAIKGEYNSKMYFFYDSNYKQKDSICAEIKDGRFYFKATAHLPIQARFHLDQHSYISDVYIESKKTYLTCANKIDIYGNDKDTMNMFFITKVVGSKSETLKREFENFLAVLKASGKSEEEKSQEYYEKLYDFIRKHPKNKVSPYLLGKASMLRYSQVSALNDLIDSSLYRTFEGKGVAKLLNSLDKTKNKSIGTAFLDVPLNDTSRTMVSTKDFRGKIILVDFWASWCKPCREANPGLKALYSNLKDKNFEIIGISWDMDWAKWKQAIIKDGLPWKQVVDEKGKYGDLGSYYDLESIPYNILIDKEGKILGVNLSSKEIEEIVSKDL